MRRRDTINSILKHKGAEIWSVSPDQSVYEAIEKMADKGVGALLLYRTGEFKGYFFHCSKELEKILSCNRAYDFPL